MTLASDEHPLVVNIAGLLGEPAGSARDFAFAGVGLDLGEGIAQAGGADILAHVARTNRGLLVRASAHTTLAEVCSRCLAPAAVALDVEIDEEVLPVLDFVTGLPLDLAAEPEVSRLSDHHELDLETLVREEFQLAEPIAPLCRPDCLGLCPQCGADLNAGPHSHIDRAVDPRLEALLAFRVDEEA